MAASQRSRAAHKLRANPIAIVVPCHRVIAKDGTLHAYAGGLHLKRALLDHEFAVTGAVLTSTR